MRIVKIFFLIMIPILLFFFLGGVLGQKVQAEPICTNTKPVTIGFSNDNYSTTFIVPIDTYYTQPIQVNWTFSVRYNYQHPSASIGNVSIVGNDGTNPVVIRLSYFSNKTQSGQFSLKRGVSYTIKATGAFSTIVDGSVSFTYQSSYDYYRYEINCANSTDLTTKTSFLCDIPAEVYNLGGGNYSVGGNVFTKPYDIYCDYIVNIESLGDYWGCTKGPYFKINGSDPGVYITTSGQPISGSFIIRANQSVQVETNSGDFYDIWGNTWGKHISYILEYQLDQAPPNAPINLKAVDSNNNEFYKKDGVYYTNELKPNFSWEIPSDNPTIFRGHTILSGIKDYLFCDGNNDEYLNNQPFWNTENHRSFIQPLAQGLHQIRVKARDKEENEGIYCDVIKIVVDTQPPVQPATLDVKQDAQNKITWTWDSVSDPELKGYQIKVINEDGTVVVNQLITSTSFNHSVIDNHKYTCSVSAVDYAGNASPEISKSFVADFSVNSVSLPQYPVKFESGFITIKWLELQDPSNISRYEVALTENENEPVTFISAGTGLSFTFSGEKSSKNTYYAWVRGVDGIENKGPWTKIGPFPSFKISAAPANTGTKLLTQNFNIEKRYPIQGDELRFRVIYKQHNSTIQYNSGVMQKGPIIVNFPSEGNWDWWLEISEFAGSQEIAESKQITETFSLPLDITIPNGSFVIKSTDGSKEYSESAPTKTESVLIIPSDINDTAGVVQSGIKGIYLWNGDSGTPPTGTNIITNIPNQITWTLPLNDGVKKVNMLIEDNAGNQTLVSKTVLLDKTAPDAPDAFTHNHSVINNKQYVRFTWGSNSSDIEKFVGIYTLPDGTTTTVDEFTKNPSGNGFIGNYDLDITALSPNKAVTLRVIAIDKAGNRSPSVVYITYTKASLGTLSSLTEGFDNTNGHYFTCTLTGGTAEHQALELCPDQQFLNTNTVTIPLVNGQFKASGLKPHTEYYYRVVAFNCSSTFNGVDLTDADKTEGTPVNYKVPNAPPSDFDVSMLKPNNFSTNDVQFNFAPINDGENDQLTYQIYWAEGNNPDPAGFQKANGDQTNGFTITLPKTAHGKIYTWFVRASESYNGTLLSTKDSPKLHFTVDTNPPEIINLDQPIRLYSNQESLGIVVRDDLSGVNRVTYKKTGASGETPITLTKLSNGDWSGNIPLSEGEYSLELMTYDQAGNIKIDTDSLNNLKVDRTLPTLSNIVVNLPLKGNQFVSASAIPITWHAADNLSGVKGLYYWLTKELPGNLNLLPLNKDNFVAGIDLMKQDFNATLQSSGINGDSYYLIMAVIDQAGNLSNRFVVNNKITLDKTPPIISDFKINGFTQYGSGYYLDNPLNLHLESFTASEDFTEVTAKKYEIVETTDGGERVVINWTTDWESIRNTGLLSNGKKYRIKAEAFNTQGLVSEVSSCEFIYDNSAPSQVQIIGPIGSVTGGETMLFTVNATENDSAITEYWLAIGLQKGGTEFTAQVPGNRNGWIVLRSNNPSEKIRVVVSTVANGAYYPILKVKNAAGIESVPVNGSQFTVDNNLNKITVHDQGPYTLRTDQLTGWWAYHGSDSVNGYEYRILGPTNQEIYPWHTTQDTQVTVREAGLTFISGSTYRFEVRAILGTGEKTNSGFSPGVTVDTSVPTIAQLETDDYSPSWNLHLHWTGNDGESGVNRIQAAVGTTPYQSDISKGWIDLAGNPANISCDVNGDKLQFVNGGKYYITLRLTNGAGLTSERAGSCVVIDDTAPPVPVVLDQGRFISTKPSQPMEAQWVWSAIDSESGNSQYEWAIVESPEAIGQAVWHNVGVQTQVSLSMLEFPRIDGKKYYFAVKVTNGSGLNSIGLSDGILVDATAPMIPKVKLLQAVNLDDPSGSSEVNYIKDLNNLKLWVKSWDPVSGIGKIKYAWGLASDVDGKPRREQDTDTDSTVISINDLTLRNFDNKKQIIFIGECFDGANNSATGYSSGVMLETGAPTIKEVNAYRAGDKYLFNWGVDLSNSISPLDHCEVALVSSAHLDGDPSQWTWIPIGVAEKYEIPIIDLSEGQYYLVIRAVNKANVASRRELNEWGISPLITLDYTAPTVNLFEYPRFVSDTIAVHIESVDPLTGIGGYQYALGSREDYKAYTGGWVDVNRYDGTLNFEVNTSGVAQNSPVYLTVRVKDGVGNWTTPGVVSETILVDHTAPSTPIVTTGKYTNSKRVISGISFTSNDSESGVTHYQIGIVTKQNETLDSQLPLLPITGFNGRYSTTFDMTEAGQYYVAVRTYNAAGLPSATGYSQAITIDTIKPQLTFTKGDTIIVVNPIAGSEPVKNIEFRLTENASVSFIQTADDGSIKTIESSGTAGINVFSFKENKPQIYTLTATPVDPATNQGDAQTQKIRVNAPPIVTIPERIDAAPGQPLTFWAEVADPDGEAEDTFTYVWDMGDGSASKTDIRPEYKYIKLGSYTLRLTVTDKDGGVTTVTTQVVISNTSKGSLYMNEVWSGVHHLYGDVTVPQNITLTILPGTQVIIDGSPEAGYDHALIIRGQLNIQGVQGREAEFCSVNNTPDGWKGIYIEGQANITGVKISNAQRGMTLLGQASVSGAILEDNMTGIHVYGSKPRIENCLFRHNIRYGIKEDEGGTPIVINCEFQNNGMDYYDDVLSRTSIDKLNTMPGNSGNR